MKITLDLDEKQLIALGMLMGIGKRADTEPQVRGFWRYLRPINDQIRKQLGNVGKAAEIYKMVEEED